MANNETGTQTMANNEAGIFCFLISQMEHNQRDSTGNRNYGTFVSKFTNYKGLYIRHQHFGIYAFRTATVYQASVGQQKFVILSNNIDSWNETATYDYSETVHSMKYL
jgi:hypothetical protein